MPFRDDPADCPSCGARMQSHVLHGHSTERITVDVCFPCHVLWLDGHESVELSAGGTLELCRLIGRNAAGPRQALAQRFACPRCRKTLAHTHDLTRSGRFTYHRCASGHGRMTPFFDFLREKHFVRTLTQTEIARMRQFIREVRCSSCGAAVHIERDAKCGHCGTALAMLDPQAVEKAVAALAKAERTRVAAAAPGDAVVTAQSPARGEPPWSHRLESGSDLVDVGIRALAALFESP
jgi:DNA-directed RNA polymerase subunit RPC12/RpoP